MLLYSESSTALLTNFDVLYQRKRMRSFLCQICFKPFGLRHCAPRNYGETAQSTEWDQVWLDFNTDRP